MYVQQSTVSRKRKYAFIAFAICSFVILLGVGAYIWAKQAEDKNDYHEKIMSPKDKVAILYLDGSWDHMNSMSKNLGERLLAKNFTVLLYHDKKYSEFSSGSSLANPGTTNYNPAVKTKQTLIYFDGHGNPSSFSQDPQAKISRGNFVQRFQEIRQNATDVAVIMSFCFSGNWVDDLKDADVLTSTSCKGKSSTCYKYGGTLVCDPGKSLIEANWMYSLNSPTPNFKAISTAKTFNDAATGIQSQKCSHSSDSCSKIHVWKGGERNLQDFSLMPEALTQINQENTKINLNKKTVQAFCKDKYETLKSNNIIPKEIQIVYASPQPKFYKQVKCLNTGETEEVDGDSFPGSFQGFRVDHILLNL